MKKLLLLILLFALPGTVALGQQGEAILKIVVDNKGKMQVFDLRQDSLQKSQPGKLQADPQAVLQQGTAKAGGEIAQEDWQNSQEPEAIAYRKKLQEKGLLQQGQTGAMQPNLENSQDPEIMQLRKKLEQNEIKGGAQAQENSERQSDQRSASGTPQATFSAFELVADSMYLRVANESGSIGPIENNPVAGRRYLIHFNWRNTGETTPNFGIEIKLNGNLICGYNSGAISTGPSITYCTAPVTWPTSSTNTIEGVLDVGNVISESNEMNNRASRTYPSPAGNFELVAGRMYLRTGGESGPEVNNPVAGQQYVIHFDWRNAGNTTPNFGIEIKLNGNLICGYNSGAIPGNSPSTTYCTAPVTWPAGSNTIEGVLDVNNDLAEANESNNRASRTFPPPPPPLFKNLTFDFNKTTWSYNSSTQVLSLTARVINVGTETASASELGYYLSKDATISTRDDFLIGTDAVESLAPNGFSDESFSADLCKISRLTTPGTYFIGWVADHTFLVSESKEDDNTAVSVLNGKPASIVVTCPPLLPNLTFDFNKTTWNFNSHTRVLSLTARVINNGDANAGSSELGYYLSTNTTITNSDFLIGTDAVGSLSPGAFSDESFYADLCKISKLATPGTYFIGWFADHTLLVDESNEHDNTAVSLDYGSPASIVVTCPVAAPNLTFDLNKTTWDFKSSTNILNLTARVVNAGDANAGSSELGYYLSTNATITTSDFLIGTDAVGSLAPGAYSDESFYADLCKISGLTTPGTYFIGWFCDHTFLVAESNENDNTAVSMSSGYAASISVKCVPPLPNLVIDPSSYGNFNTATCDLYINAKVCNTGDASAGHSRVGYYLSSDAYISTSDCLVGDDGTTVLAPGACSVFTPTLNLRNASCINIPGTYYFGMIADYLKAVTESNESDNDAVFKPALNLTCPPECVVVGRVECPPSVQEGAQFTVTVFVNMGGCPAPNHRLGSFTSKLAWNSSLLGFVSHSGLRSDFTGTVNTNKVGTGTLEFNGANSSGAGGDVKLLSITFKAVGASGKNGTLDLSFSAMSAASSFKNLLPNLKVNDCPFKIEPGGICGDVNDDKVVNSTDALILLSHDVGMHIPPAFLARINQGCGDLNRDGLTNSTDALICLSCDANLPHCPTQVGKPGSCK